MANITKNIVDIDENLRLLGTAHVSKTSVNLVREQINLPADIQCPDGPKNQIFHVSKKIASKPNGSPPTPTEGSRTIVRRSLAVKQKYLCFF